MKQFNVTITDPLGLHARVAAQLVKVAQVFLCSVTIGAKGKTASGKGIMGIMQLCAKQGDTLSVTCQGEDEEAAIAALESFATCNL